MKITTKNTVVAILFGYMIASCNAIAVDNTKTTVVEISANQEELTTIKAETDGISEIIELTPEELVDDALLETKLSVLDDKTQQTVMQALQDTRHIVDGSVDFTQIKHLANHGQHKMIVINGGEGQVVKHIDDIDVVVDFDNENDNDHKVVHKQVIIDASEHTVIKGHTDAIVRLIEKGEFTKEELDTIQNTLDAKR
jgi:hypothetical protein